MVLPLRVVGRTHRYPPAVDPPPQAALLDPSLVRVVAGRQVQRSLTTRLSRGCRVIVGNEEHDVGSFCGVPTMGLQ